MADTRQEGIREMVSALKYAYECDYPEREVYWLQKVCDDYYGGDVSEMKHKYLTPTLTLLKRMKEVNFPLTKNNKVIVHLFPFKHALNVGEFYFQTSKSCPGELALKFTKYSTQDEYKNALDNPRYEVQFTTISVEDLAKVFSLSYLENLRRTGKEKNNTERTSVSLRLCVVSDVSEDKSDVVDCEDIMPDNIDEHIKHMDDDDRIQQKSSKLPKYIMDLTTSQIRALAMKMDPINAIGDYQNLADELNFTWKDIGELFKNRPSPTQELISVLQQKHPHYLVSDIVNYLSEMNRHDAIQAMCDAEDNKRRDKRSKRAHMPVQESVDEENSDDILRKAEESDETAVGIQNTSESDKPSPHCGCTGDSLHSDIHKQFANPESKDSGDSTPSSSAEQPLKKAYVRESSDAVNPLITGKGIHGSAVPVSGQYIRGDAQTNQQADVGNGVRNGYTRGNPKPSAVVTGLPSKAAEVTTPLSVGLGQYKRENRDS